MKKIGISIITASILILNANAANVIINNDTTNASNIINNDDNFNADDTFTITGSEDGSGIGTLNGTITTTTNNTGSLILGNGTDTINIESNIGTSTNQLKLLDITGNSNVNNDAIIETTNLNINGNLINKIGATLNASGIISIDGTFINNNISNFTNVLNINDNGIVTNNKTLNVNGINVDGLLINNDTINADNIVVNGTLTNNNTINITNTLTINNDTTLNDGSNLTASSIELNNATLTNESTLVANITLDNNTLNLNNGSLTGNINGDGIINLNGGTMNGDISSDTTTGLIVNVIEDFTQNGNMGTIGLSNNPANVNISDNKTLNITNGEINNLNLDLSSKIIASGNLNLENVTITDNNNEFIDGQSYTIVSANDLNVNNTINVPTNTTFKLYNVSTIDEANNNNEIIVTTSFASADSLGLNKNEANIYNGLKPLISNDLNLSNSLGSLSLSDLKTSINTMGINNDGIVENNVNLLKTNNSIISKHLNKYSGNSTISGLSSGEEVIDNNVWLRYFNISSEQNAIDTKPGYDSKTEGIIAGYDKILKNGVIGIAGTLNKGETKSKDLISNSNTDSNSKQITLYGLYNFADFYINGSLGYGMGTNENSRDVVIGSNTTKIKGEYETSILSAQIGLGTELIYDGIYIHPSIDLNYFSVSNDQYTETGGGSLNLEVEDQTYNENILRIGTIIGKSFDIGGEKLTPFISGGINASFGDDFTTTKSKFIGTTNTFETEGYKNKSIYYDYGVGLGYLSWNKLITMSFNWNHTERGEYSDDAFLFNLGIKY